MNFFPPKDLAIICSICIIVLLGGASGRHHYFLRGWLGSSAMWTSRCQKNCQWADVSEPDNNCSFYLLYASEEEGIMPESYHQPLDSKKEQGGIHETTTPLTMLSKWYIHIEKRVLKVHHSDCKFDLSLSHNLS